MATLREDDAPVDRTSPLADPGTRLAARTVEGLLMYVPALALVPAGIALGSATAIRVGLVGTVVTGLVVLALNLVFLHRYGQTVGKRMLGLRIVTEKGPRATLGRLVGLRYVVPFLLESVPVLGPLFTLVDALFIFSETRQTIHDRFARTIVVDLRRGESLDREDTAETFR